MSPKARRTALFLALAAVVALIVFDPPEQSDSRLQARAAAQQDAGPRRGISTTDRARVELALPQRAELGDTKGELFVTTPLPAPVPRAPAARSAVKEEPPAPVVPPTPYTFVGRLVQNGQQQGLLAHADLLITVKPGEMLEGGYRVDAVTPEEVTLTYMPLQHRIRLPISEAPTATANAAGFAPRIRRAEPVRGSGERRTFVVP